MSIPPALVARFLAKNPVRDFDLDFRNGIYRRNGLVIPTLEGVGGFSHTQSGACSEIAPNGSLVAFSANQPRVVPGLGLWARSGFTNILINSKDIKLWNQGSNATITSDAIVAPDGSMTADRWERSSTAAAYKGQTSTKATSAIQYTASLFVKADSARYCAIRTQGLYPARAEVVFDLQTGTISTAPFVSGGFANASGSIEAVGGGWFFVTLTATSDTYGSLGFYFSFNSNGLFLDSVDSAANSSGYVWQRAFYAGSQRGPLIETTSVAASNGVAQLTLPFVQKDEDFVLLVAFNMAEGSTAATRYLATIFGSTFEAVGLYLTNVDTVSRLCLAGGVQQPIGAFSGTPIASGRGVASLRFRGQKLSVADKAGAGAPNIGAEGTTITFPSGLTSLRVGHFNGSQQAGGFVERVRIVPGTYDNTQWGNLITAMAA